jgi:hypothetical protein
VTLTLTLGSFGVGISDTVSLTLPLLAFPIYVSREALRGVIQRESSTEL